MPSIAPRVFTPPNVMTPPRVFTPPNIPQQAYQPTLPSIPEPNYQPTLPTMPEPMYVPPVNNGGGLGGFVRQFSDISEDGQVIEDQTGVFF